MLRQRLAADKKVVSLYDPALQQIEQTLVLRYGLTRDYSLIEGKFVDELPAVFTLTPLKQEHEHLTESPAILFQYYVKKVENVPPQWVAFDTAPNNKQFLSDESMKCYPRDVVNEIANLVIQFASRDGEAIPFSLPDGWKDYRREAQLLRAMSAHSATNASSS